MEFLAKVDSTLNKCSCREIAIVCLMVMGLIGGADYLSGQEISVSVFYLIPIAISAWYCGHRAGIIFSILSAATWMFLDLANGSYHNPVAPYWNTAVRLGFFLVTEGLLNKIKILLSIEKSFATRDALTGLLNYRGFAEQVETLFDLAVRHDRQLILAYIDLDNFKKVNDDLGHSEGNHVLQAVGEIITTSLRATDVAGRLGGDEFAIALPETDEAGAQIVFETLRTALLQAVKKYRWPITLSIGVVSFDSPALSFDEAIKIADIIDVPGQKERQKQHHFRALLKYSKCPLTGRFCRSPAFPETAHPAQPAGRDRDHVPHSRTSPCLIA